MHTTGNTLCFAYIFESSLFSHFFRGVLRCGDLFQGCLCVVTCGARVHTLSRWYHFLSFIPSDDGSVNPYSACVYAYVQPSQKMFTLFTPLIPGWERGWTTFYCPFRGRTFTCRDGTGFEFHTRTVLLLPSETCEFPETTEAITASPQKPTTTTRQKE